MIILFADRRIPYTALADILHAAREHPGTHDVEVRVGDHVLKLGAEYRMAAAGAAPLSEFGEVELC